MSFTQIPELYSAFKEISSRLVEHTTDHQNTKIPGLRTFQSLSNALTEYERIITAKEPYYFSIDGNVDGEGRNTHLGFFTKHGSEIAAIISEQSQEVFLGCRTPSLEVSVTDMPISLKINRPSSDLSYYRIHLPIQLIDQFNDLAVSMVRSSKNRFAIDAELRKIRDSLMLKK